MTEQLSTHIPEYIYVHIYISVSIVCMYILGVEYISIICDVSVHVLNIC